MKPIPGVFRNMIWYGIGACFTRAMYVPPWQEAVLYAVFWALSLLVIFGIWYVVAHFKIARKERT
jgi:membrane protein implicated in regulation of membrane protease activity